MTRERPVGEVFKLYGVKVVVVPDVEGVNNCKLCVIRNEYLCTPPNILEVGECVGGLREDGVNVHFERYYGCHHLTRHLHGGKKSPVATDREQ